MKSVTRLTYRPVRQHEVGLAADVMTAAFPREPQDPELTAYGWAHPREGWSYARFFAELTGKQVAFVEWQHGPWSQLPERHCYVDVWLDQAHTDENLLTESWTWIAEAALAEGARTLNAAAAEDEPKILKVLADLGYVRDRTERVWTLDLRTHGERIGAEAGAARDRLATAGIRFLPLSEWNDPSRYEKLHALNEVTRQDIPHSSPVLPQTLDDFMAKLGSPGTPHDRWWVALNGSEAVAMSYLSYPPRRGVVWTSYTCSHPAYRGRGIARAVKLQSLAQAVELGVPEVRTENDSENVAMLHINQTLGYELMPGYVSFAKRLRARALR